MITDFVLIPDRLERRFGQTRSVQQVPRAQTHKGGARNDTIGVQNASRPECLRHSPQLLVHVFLRDLVKVSADDHICPPIDPARDQFRETLPVTTGKFFKGHDRHDRVRVGCHKTDERFKIELSKEIRGDHQPKGDAHITETFPNTLVVKLVIAEMAYLHSEILTGKSMNYI